VQEAVVAQLLADALEDLGEGSLAQTLHLEEQTEAGRGSGSNAHMPREAGNDREGEGLRVRHISSKK